MRLRIESMGRRGEGLARVEDKPVYIPYTLPGEDVEAALSGDRGTLTTILSPSADRIVPFCPHFGACGGCLTQHWSPPAYRDWKRGLVVEALRQRGIAADVAPIVEAHGEGRRRVSLHIRRKGQNIEAGFMRLRSHDLHDIDRCPILAPGLKDIFDIARRLGTIAGDTDAAFTATMGGIDVSLKGARDLSEAAKFKLIDLAQELRLARLSLHHEPLIERAPPELMMGKARVRVPPISFLQATTLGEEALAERVAKSIAKAKRAADLFCGLGPFTLRLAERMQLLAIDNDAAAVKALATAARTTPGLKPVKTETRDLFRDPLMPGELAGFDAVAIDPPRAGAEAQMRQLARSKVSRIASVSCDPGTFARDAAILTAGGYRLEQVTAIDQFGWSAHVEIVGAFRR